MHTHPPAPSARVASLALALAGAAHRGIGAPSHRRTGARASHSPAASSPSRTLAALAPLSPLLALHMESCVDTDEIALGRTQLWLDDGSERRFSDPAQHGSQANCRVLAKL